VLDFRRKLTSVNRAKLELTASFNDQSCQLHTQNAALHAQISAQNEAYEKLEYDLDVAKHQIMKEKNMAEKQAAQNAETITQLESKDKINGVFKFVTQILRRLRPWKSCRNSYTMLVYWTHPNARKKIRHDQLFENDFAYCVC